MPLYIIKAHMTCFQRVPWSTLFVKPPKEWPSFYALSGQERHAIFRTKAASAMLNKVFSKLFRAFELKPFSPNEE